MVLIKVLQSLVEVGKQLICCTIPFGFILEGAPKSLKITV